MHRQPTPSAAIILTLKPTPTQNAAINSVDNRPDAIARSSASAATGSATALPRPPAAGYFGRDETLLALDRAFDTQPVVLLHAFAGAGKSSTAAEFATKPAGPL